MKKLKLWDALLYTGLLLGIMFIFAMVIGISKTQGISEAKNNFCISKGYEKIDYVVLENHTIRCRNQGFGGASISCKGKKWC